MGTGTVRFGFRVRVVVRVRLELGYPGQGTPVAGTVMAMGDPTATVTLTGNPMVAHNQAPLLPFAVPRQLPFDEQPIGSAHLGIRLRFRANWFSSPCA